MTIKVLELFTKTNNSFQEAKTLNLIKNVGIENDINATLNNPRQILIASNSVIKEFNLAPSDLKANIILDDNIEQFESGQVIQIGDSALVRLTFHCEPCYKLDQLYKGLAKKIIGKRGFLGMVIESGTINTNAQVTLSKLKMASFSDVAKERFVSFISKIPEGKCIKTSDIILALGLARGYYRAIPGYLKSYQDTLPVHRIVTVQGELMEKYIPFQKDKLLAEGIIIEENKVLDKYYWNISDFFKA